VVDEKVKTNTAIVNDIDVMEMMLVVAEEIRRKVNKAGR